MHKYFLIIIDLIKTDTNIANDRYKDADNIRASELGLNRNYERNDYGVNYGYADYGQGRGYGGGYGGGGGPSRRNPYGRNGDSDGRYSVFGLDRTSGHGINGYHGIGYEAGYGRNRAELASHAHADAHADAAAHAYGYGDDVRHGRADANGFIGSFDHAYTHGGHGRGYGAGGMTNGTVLGADGRIYGADGRGYGLGGDQYGYAGGALDIYGRGGGLYGRGDDGIGSGIGSGIGFGALGWSGRFGHRHGRGGYGTTHRQQGAFRGSGSYGDPNVYGNGNGSFGYGGERGSGYGSGYGYAAGLKGRFARSRGGVYSPTYGKGGGNGVISLEARALREGEIDDEIANLSNRAARGDQNAKDTINTIRHGSVPAVAAIEADRNERRRNITNNDVDALAQAGSDDLSLLKIKAREYLNKSNYKNLGHIKLRAASGNHHDGLMLEDLKRRTEEAEGVLAEDPLAIEAFSARVEIDEHMDNANKAVYTPKDLRDLKNSESVKKVAKRIKNKMGILRNGGNLNNIINYANGNLIDTEGIINNRSSGILGEPIRRHIDGSVSYSDGTISHADGTISHADGSISYVSPIVNIYADGTISHVDGTISHADGSVSYPSTRITRDGSVTYDNGSIMRLDGTLINADGSIVDKNGSSTINLDGSITNKQMNGDGNVITRIVNTDGSIINNTISNNIMNEDGSITTTSINSDGSIRSINNKNSKEILDRKMYPNGNIVYNDGTIRNIDGTKIFRDGTISHPIGSITHPDGKITHPDGTVYLPDGRAIRIDGTTSHPDGSVTDLNGYITNPNGSVSYPDGSLHLVSGDIIRPDNSVIHPDGSITNNNGSRSHIDGSVSHPNGSITHSDGNVSHADGSISYGDGSYKHPNGSITDKIGRTIHNDGHIEYPNGSTTYPNIRTEYDITNIDGSISHPNGTKTNIDGTVNQPDGSLKNIDGSVINPNGRISHLDGSITENDGSVKQVDGTVVKLDGTVIRRNGTIIHPDGSINKSDGSIITPDGRTINPDGSIIMNNKKIIHPDGTVIHPDGTIIKSDNTIINIDGSVTKPDGITTTINKTVIYPDGTVTKPNNSIIHPDGTITTGDGKIKKPDGSIIHKNGSITFPSRSTIYDKLNSDGSINHPNGTITNIDGNVIHPDGSIEKTDGSVINPKNGRTSHSDGTITESDGTRIYTDGSMTESDGTKTDPDGTRIYNDGTIIKPNGTIEKTDGTIIYNDGTAITPDGSTITTGKSYLMPDGITTKTEYTIRRNDGTIIHPNGSITNSDGTIRHLDGSITEKDGSVITVDGSKIHPNGEFTDNMGNTTDLNGDTIKSDGDIIKRNGDIIKPNGNIIKPNLDVIKSNGDIIKPNGNIIKVNGDIIKVNGDIVKSNGDIIKLNEDVVKTKEIFDTDGKKIIIQDLEHKDGSITNSDGITKHLNGNITYPNGITKHLDGSIKHADGSITRSDGMKITNNGKLITKNDLREFEDNVLINSNSIIHKNGSIINSDGTISTIKTGGHFNKDGTITHPDGSKTEKDGTITHLDGRITYLNGSILHKNGSITHPDGTISHKNGSVTQKDGSIIDINGIISHPDGSITDKWGNTTHIDGTITDIHGTNIYTDGSTIESDGTKITSDGTVFNTDGSIIYRDGTIIKSNGSITNSDGTIIKNDGTIIKPNGTIKNSDGTIIKPDGTIITNLGSTINTDGSKTYSNNTTKKTDGTLKNSDGSITYPDGTTKYSDGRIEENKHSLKSGVILESDGSVKNTTNGIRRLDGSIINLDGSIMHPDGSKTESNGNVIQSDGTIIKTDGSIIQTDGSIIDPDGIKTLIDGTIIDPDGIKTLTNGTIITQNKTVITPNGTVIYPDGTKISIDGTVTEFNGTITLPDGTNISPEGSIKILNDDEQILLHKIQRDAQSTTSEHIARQKLLKNNKNMKSNLISQLLRNADLKRNNLINNKINNSEIINNLNNNISNNINTSFPNVLDEQRMYEESIKEGNIYASKQVYTPLEMAAMTPEQRKRAAEINHKNATSKAAGAAKAAAELGILNEQIQTEEELLNEMANIEAQVAQDTKAMINMLPNERITYMQTQATARAAAQANEGFARMIQREQLLETESLKHELGQKKLLDDLNIIADNALHNLAIKYPAAFQAFQNKDNDTLNLMMENNENNDLKEYLEMVKRTKTNYKQAEENIKKENIERKSKKYALQAHRAANKAILAARAMKPSLARAYQNISKYNNALSNAAKSHAVGDIINAKMFENEAIGYERLQNVNNKLAIDAEEKAKERLNRVNNAVGTAMEVTMAGELARAREEEIHDNEEEAVKAAEAAEKLSIEVSKANENMRAATAAETMAIMEEKSKRIEEEKIKQLYAKMDVNALGLEMARQNILKDLVKEKSGKTITKEEIKAIKTQNDLEMHRQKSIERAKHINHNNLNFSKNMTEPSLYHKMNATEFLEETRRHQEAKNKAKAESSIIVPVVEKNKEQNIRNEIEIEKAQKIAIQNVTNLGGTAEEALKAGEEAIIEMKKKLKNEKETNDIKKTIDNNILNDITENKEIEEAKNSVLKMIKDSETIVKLQDGIIELPFIRTSNIKAMTVEDEKRKLHQIKLRDILRNKFTNQRFVSGLPLILDKTGFFNVPESAQKIIVKHGEVYYTQEAYEEMKAKKLDISGLKPRVGGYNSPMPNESAYYVAEVTDMFIDLPTPLNMHPLRVLRNNKEQLDISHGTKLIINDGELLMEPWAEYSKYIHPTVYQQSNTMKQELWQNQIKEFEKKERRNANLRNSEVELVANKDGNTFAQITPAYGIIAHDSAEEAAEKLVRAHSRIIPEDSEDDLNIDGGNDGSSAIDEFVNTVKTTAENAKHIINPINPVNNLVNVSLAQIVPPQRLHAYYRDEKTLGDKLFNTLLRRSAHFSKQLKIPIMEFSERLNQLTPMAFNSLIEFYTRLAINPNSTQEMAKIDIQSFSFEFKNAFPLHNISELYLVFSTVIREITGQPNLAKDKIRIINNLEGLSTNLDGTKSIINDSINNTDTIIRHMTAKSMPPCTSDSCLVLGNIKLPNILEKHLGIIPVENTTLKNGNILQTTVTGNLPIINNLNSKIIGIDIDSNNNLKTVNPCLAKLAIEKEKEKKNLI